MYPGNLCVIFDFDGTLAKTNHLFHLADRKNHNYEQFHNAAVYAHPIKWSLKSARGWHSIGVPVMISTARSEMYRKYTEHWLNIWFKDYHSLIMRSNEDFRPDVETKEDHLHFLLDRGWNILKAYDDNPEIIEMYHDHNINTMTLPGWKDESTVLSKNLEV